MGKSDSPEAHKAALHNPKIRGKIENFLTNKFLENSDGVNQANNNLTEIMCKAANLSLTTKRPVKKYKTHKSKKWFNKECEKAKVSFKKSVNAANRDSSDLTLVKESSEKLTEFKKNRKDKQNEYWEKTNDKLFSTNDENFCLCGNNVMKVSLQVKILLFVM